MPTTSPPINFGQAGLVLGLRVYFQTGGDAPVLQIAGVETVEELTLGDYYLAGLPDPPGGDFAIAVVFDPAGGAALALSTYEYRSAAAPAIASPVINLGEAGLALAVRVYFRAPGEAPVLQVAGAESVEDLGSGDYYIAALPNPPAGSRGIAVVYDPAGDEALALTTYEYGSATAVSAASAPSVIWRNEIELPANPQPLKVGDTYGSIALTVLSGLPAEIATATVTLSLWDREASVGFALDSPASISDIFLDAATDSYGCTLSCAVADLSEDLEAASYLAEFEITFPGLIGKTTIPKDDRMEIVVLRDFNAG